MYHGFPLGVTYWKTIGMSSEKYPQISDELITYLEQVFRDQLPRDYLGEFDMGTLFGKVEVVRHLKMIRDTQRENMLSNQLMEK